MEVKVWSQTACLIWTAGEPGLFGGQWLYYIPGTWNISHLLSSWKQPIYSPLVNSHGNRNLVRRCMKSPIENKGDNPRKTTQPNGTINFHPSVHPTAAGQWLTSPHLPAWYVPRWPLLSHKASPLFPPTWHRNDWPIGQWLAFTSTYPRPINKGLIFNKALLRETNG